MLNRKINRRDAIKFIGAGVLGAFGARKLSAQERFGSRSGTLGSESRSTEKIINTKGSSIRSIIEGWPGVQTQEMELYKIVGKSGEVREWMVFRSPHKVSSNHPVFPATKSTIHTHLLNSANWHLTTDYKIKRQAYISPEDFRGLSHLLQKKVITTPTVFHVALIDEKGLVIGYTSIRLSKKFFELYNASDSNLSGILEGLKEDFSSKPTENEVDSYLELLYKLKGCGVQIMGTPMPGYIFKDRYFQRR